MWIVSVLMLFAIYAAFTAGYFAICHFYGGYIATLTGGMIWFHFVLLCLACALLWGTLLALSVKYIRYATHKFGMFRKSDKYGLKSTSPFGIGILAVLSAAAALVYAFALLQREHALVTTGSLALILSYLVVNYVLFVLVWSRCQTYLWCPKCGRFWGKSYYVADEIGRETHEYKYKERERASTVENAQGNLVASVYNDVEKTGYTVRYYYRLRHKCRHCGDWEEQINIEKPTMFDGAWLEAMDTADVTEHINLTLTARDKSEQAVSAPPEAVPLPPQPQATPLPAQPQPPVLEGQEQAYLQEIAIKQLQNKNP